MRASSRMKIIIPLVSAMSLLAPSAQAQDAPPAKSGAQPPAVGGGAPAQQNTRKGPPPQQAIRNAPPQGGQVHVDRGPGRYVAHGPAPARDWGGQAYRGHLAWEGGRWRHENHNGRFGWWWDVGGVWYYYPERMAGPPEYIS